MADDKKPGNAYYDPSTAAAILFAVLFGLSTAAHIFQGIWHKKVGADQSLRLEKMMVLSVIGQLLT